MGTPPCAQAAPSWFLSPNQLALWQPRVPPGGLQRLPDKGQTRTAAGHVCADLYICHQPARLREEEAAHLQEQAAHTLCMHPRVSETSLTLSREAFHILPCCRELEIQCRGWAGAVQTLRHVGARGMRWLSSVCQARCSARPSSAHRTHPAEGPTCPPKCSIPQQPAQPAACWARSPGQGKSPGTTLCSPCPEARARCRALPGPSPSLTPPELCRQEAGTEMVAFPASVPETESGAVSRCRRCPRRFPGQLGTSLLVPAAPSAQLTQ